MVKARHRQVRGNGAAGGGHGEDFGFGPAIGAGELMNFTKQKCLAGLQARQREGFEVDRSSCSQQNAADAFADFVVQLGRKRAAADASRVRLDHADPAIDVPRRHSRSAAIPAALLLELVT